MVYFNPGCALNLYKPDKAETLLALLKTQFADISMHTICCHYDPKVPTGSRIINVCAGCDRRFRTLYEGVSTVSLWEIIDGADDFPFPNYSGTVLSIQDPCPVRERPKVHRAVRGLLEKMKIQVIEPANSGIHSICCGDNFYPALPVDKVHEKMFERGDAMSCDEVCVYCVSCIKSMHIAGKKPRYLLDILMGESTEPQECDTVKWHNRLGEYRALHTE